MKKQFLLLLVIMNYTFYFNAKAQWIQTGLSNKILTFLYNSGTNLYVGGEGLYVSTNNGANWTEIDSGLSPVVWSLGIKDTYLFAGIWEGGIYRSTNKGASWKDVYDGWGYGNSYGVESFIVNETTVFALTTSGVFSSSNNGNSWSSVNTGSQINMLGAVGNNLFADSSGVGVYLSTDNGASWKSTGLANIDVNTFSAIDTNLFAGTSSGVYLSTDNGTNWSYAGLKNKSIRIFATNDTNLFALIGISEIYLYTNKDTSWEEVDSGIANLDIQSIAVNSDYLFACPYQQGVWRRPLSEIITSIKKDNTVSPSRFLLEQNYPNPFNPATIISYAIPKASFVSIKIYNILGQEVSTLVNKEKLPGNYTVQFNASGLVSGIYFYRMQAGNFVETKKLILLK